MIPRHVFAISSHVAYGTVGLRALGPALSSLGCNGILVPSVVLSNHPGHRHTSGEPVAASFIAETAKAHSANGWLSGLAALITGYLPSCAHVEAASEALLVARSQSPGLTYVFDPICGDDPNGLYLGEAAACALRDILLPLADITTPNRFELAWLTGQKVTNADEAVAAARSLKVPTVVATSIPAGHGDLATVLVTGDGVQIHTLAKRPGVPHGTGDLLSGLLTGYLARGLTLDESLRRAHVSLEAVIDESAGRDQLHLSTLTALANLT